jgi:hypothetical protein
MKKLSKVAFVTLSLMATVQSALCKEALTCQPFACQGSPDDGSVAQFRNKGQGLPLYIRNASYFDNLGGVINNIQPTPSNTALFSMVVTPTATSSALNIGLYVQWTAPAGAGLSPLAPTSITPGKKGTQIYTWNLSQINFDGVDPYVTILQVAPFADFNSPPTQPAEVWFNDFVFNGETAHHVVTQFGCYPPQ